MLDTSIVETKMSAKKKPWVRSAFSELSITPKSNSDVVPIKRTRSATLRAADNTRSKIKNITPNTETVVDVPVNGDELDCPSTVIPVVSDNWMDCFSPVSSEDLAVHPKKVGDVRNWFQHCNLMCRRHPAQICLLTGPAGSGKTATLRVLAEEFGYELQEWINPIDCEEINVLGDQPNECSHVGSQLAAFKSFLLRASRYKSLLAKHNKRMLLVEDFPNVFLKDGAAVFEELLEEYVNYGKSPLVFIVADSKSRVLNISYKLFTDQLKANLRIEHISFNPIAATIMQKSMKRFTTLMQQAQYKVLYKAPTQSVLDSIVVCAQGDIRNALINLHFGSLRGAPSVATKQLNVTAPGKGRNRKATSTLKSIGRDRSITMMHALGRVFNPKCNGDTDKSLLHSPEELSEAFSTEPRNFLNFIHANYLPHFQDIDSVNAAIHDLGVADILLQEYRDDSLSLVALNIAVRGCMVSNMAPVTGWMPVRGPKRLAIEPQVAPGEQKLLGAAYAGISKRLYASEYSSFIKTIAENTK